MFGVLYWEIIVLPVRNSIPLFLLENVTFNLLARMDWSRDKHLIQYEPISIGIFPTGVLNLIIKQI